MKGSALFILLLVVWGCDEAGTTEQQAIPVPDIVETVDTLDAMDTSSLGPPIDINALKHEPWLDVTSGVLGPKDIAKICPNAPPEWFFGHYYLLDKEEISGPVGKLTIYKKSKGKGWFQDDQDEELMQLETRSSRIRAWGKVSVGSTRDSVLAFIGQHFHYTKGLTLVASIGEYHCVFSLADGVVYEMTIRRDCGQSVGPDEGFKEQAMKTDNPAKQQ